MQKNHAVTVGTIIRTVVLVLALVNQILTAAGASPLPIDDETAAQLISTVATVAASLAAWWKNNSFTAEAIDADEYLRRLRGKQ